MRLRRDSKTKRLYGKGTHIIYTPLPFSSIASGQALCADGRLRAFEATGDADTYFSVPVRVTLRQKNFAGRWKTYTITGCIMITHIDYTKKEQNGELNYTDEDYVFFSAMGKNKNLIPNIQEVPNEER